MNENYTKLEEYMYISNWGKTLYCVVGNHACSTYTEFQEHANLTDEDLLYYKLKYGEVSSQKTPDFIPLNPPQTKQG